MRTLRFQMAAHQETGGGSIAAVLPEPAPAEPGAAEPGAASQVAGAPGAASQVAGAPSPAPESAAQVAGAPAAAPATDVPAAGRRVRRRDILNLLNFINFRDGSISVCFASAERGDVVSFPAVPLPCADEVLSCRWLVPAGGPEALSGYECSGLLISDGENRVSVEAELLGMDAEGATFRLPESGYEKTARSIDRFPCAGIEARLIQQGICFEGVLADFNAESFRVEIGNASAGSLRWLNPAAPVMALFSRQGALLYSRECSVRRTGPGRASREIVLAPSPALARRYVGRRHRSERLALTPAPTARFRHPFTGRKVDLQASDISASGLQVEEFVERSMLLPGLIIPELAVDVGNDRVLSCRAQVLYRNAVERDGGKGAVRCGIVFLDIDAQDQARLSSLLHRSIDDRLRICGQVDMDELWRFFFESGFIYPAKYLSIQPRKDEFKRTYEKIYLKSPSIARHFIFQDKGRIFGHMSMIRFYPDTWIIHHHAASRSGYAAAGVEVLDQVGRYVNEFYHHPSAHIDYLLCYYREENRFPARVFGGVVRDIGDPKGSSVDALSYLRLPAAEAGGSGAAPFQLYPARAEDLSEARRSYEALSGGLMLDALDLLGDPESPEDGALTAEFSRQGFRRERRVFCLEIDGALKAVISLTLSDMGLNLSNLTNCAHALVLDGAGLPPRTLMAALRSILRRYAAEDVPILVFPSAFLEGSGVDLEKEYMLWVLNMDHGDDYLDSIDKTFRRRPDAGN